MAVLENLPISKRFSVGAALLMSFLLLYLVPKVLGEVGEDYAELSALQEEHCEDGRPALGSAQALFRWQERFPFWDGKHIEAQLHVLEMLVSRRCDSTLPHDELMERIELAQTLLLALQTLLPQYEDSPQFQTFDQVREKVERALFGWGYPERVLSLSKALGAKGEIEIQWGYAALADVPGLIAAPHPQGSWRGIQGALRCLHGDVEGGLTILQSLYAENLDADNSDHFGALAECYLRNGSYVELVELTESETRRLEQDWSHASVDYYRVMAAMEEGLNEAEGLLRQSERIDRTTQEWVLARQGKWDALYFGEKPMFPGPTPNLPSEHFLSHDTPFEAIPAANEHVILQLAQELAAAQSPRAPEIHRRASHYYLVLAVNLAARWDLGADQYFEKSMALAPEWKLPAILQEKFAFAHGQWHEEQAKQINANLAKAIQLGPKHQYTNPWQGGGVDNYHQLGDLLASSLTAAQKMDVLRQDLGTNSTADMLWRLTNLIVVGEFYEQDVSRWREHLARLRKLRGILAQGRWQAI